MKKQILTAIAVLGCLCGYAQTKGTSALGFGANVHSSKTKNENLPENTSNTTNRNFSLSYGLFVKDNAKLGVELNYGKNKNSNTEGFESSTKSYGANVTYQQYYPLIKKLYAYAGARAGYGETRQESSPDPTYGNIKGNQYTIGAYGGVTWFVSKRFAFETSLLSANAFYATYKQKTIGTSVIEHKQTNFDLSTSGVFRDLGFKIYLLF
ncbi:hypothetical protein ABIE26_001696 [Pedobacter africanus]|uniref:Uncharacterized protein n=1 Tax=Pedobacter africanus TaxID=151894 RepID=A0ACC6KRU0_9SPHI|nr:hypothetical protein [Pedobacter africanus]MDR6781816.1 hypothetical protein [Pedobacter africanus]